MPAQGYREGPASRSVAVSTVRGGLVTAVDVRQHDLRRILEVVAAGRSEPADATPLPWATLDGLLGLVPCDRGVTYLEADVRRTTFAAEQEARRGERYFAGPEDDAREDDG